MKYSPLVFLLSITPALAQQPQQSPAEQALGSKLMQEINAGLQCTQQLIGANKQIEQLQARIKELESNVQPSQLPKIEK
jgi:hypothetical protein